MICAWCDSPAIGEIEVEPAIVRKVKRDGELVELVVQAATWAPACATHSHPQMTSDHEKLRAYRGRIARDWAKRQMRIG